MLPGHKKISNTSLTQSGVTATDGFKQTCFSNTCDVGSAPLHVSKKQKQN